MTHKVVVELPEELVDLVGGENEISILMLQATVAHMVRHRFITASKAALLLSVNPQELKALLSRFEVYVDEK